MVSSTKHDLRNRNLFVKVYLADMKDFAAMNEVYVDFLPPNPPSRTCIAAAALPGAGTIVEIECIAQV